MNYDPEAAIRRTPGKPTLAFRNHCDCESPLWAAKKYNGHGGAERTMVSCVVSHDCHDCHDAASHEVATARDMWMLSALPTHFITQPPPATQNAPSALPLPTACQ